MTIREKVTYILANYPETRDSKSKLCLTYIAYYKASPTCIPTVDREARYIQNTLGLYQPCLEEQKKRQKHSTKAREKYRSSRETSVLKRENTISNFVLS